MGTIQARTHVQLAVTCQQSMLQHKSRLTMQHVCGHTGNLGNECADHAAALGTLGLVSNHDLALHVGFAITLIPLLVVVLATTLAKSWKNCVTLELEQQRHLRTGFSAVSLIVFSLTSTHATHHTLFALSPFPMRSPFAAPWCT